ncbi:MAG: peptidoglycan DD-metalloendopeptidase family protein [Sphingobacteriales bacterium]|nr:peptidoglycan DD-metalloendopeptidase family protein [Sphingobacteriales bacterium]
MRNLKAGHGYTVLCDADQKAQYFIYESDPTMYVMLDFTGGTGTVDVKKRQIERKIKTASGVINSSLYLTLEQNKISPKIAVKLAQVYAWSVDFFHLQKGDYFKILYEEIYADGKLVGVGEIKSAVFNQNSEDNYAIYFEKDDTRGYYDEKNNLLQRSFLRAPVEYGRISSRYNRSRFHPVLKTVRAHLGTDFAAPYGTPIISTADGTVQKVGYTSGNGNFVKIKHDQTYETQYLHMSKFAKGVKIGTHIKQGQVIGYVGSTGLATGPHVCYRFWKNGTQVDPLREKFSVSKPIDKKMLPYYAVHRDSMVALLRDIQLPSEETVQVATIASQTDSH